MTSVLSALSCSRFDRIQSAMPMVQSATNADKSAVQLGLQDP
jgi:hypothetical protein